MHAPVMMFMEGLWLSIALHNKIGLCCQRTYEVEIYEWIPGLTGELEIVTKGFPHLPSARVGSQYRAK
jgi:hypothetical protein